MTRPSAPRLIVNADDLGMSSEINRRIVECFEAGRITSATLMANGPAFEEACDLVERHRLHGRIGVHLNLTEFAPLSESAARLWGEGGLRFPEARLWIPRSWIPAVRDELDLQIRRVLDAGIRPTHADSHNHVLNGMPYLQVALSVLREHGIDRLRPARNRFYRSTPALRAVKAGYNGTLRLCGFHSPRSFADVKPFVDHILDGGPVPEDPIEAMCHPGARLSGPWRGARDEADILLGRSVGEAFGGFTLIGYSEL